MLTRDENALPSHYHTVLVLGLVLLFQSRIFRRGDVHGSPTGRRSSNSTEPLAGTLVTCFCGLDIPDVGLQNVPPAADAHLSKIGHGILRFDKTYAMDISIYSPDSQVAERRRKHTPSSADLRAHSYASSSSFSRIGSAPIMYQAHSPIMAPACPRSAAPV